MKRQQLAYLCALMSLMLLPLSACANLIFPSQVVLAGIYNMFGWSLILLALIIEFTCLYYLTRKPVLRVLITTTLMNAVSAVIGLRASMSFDLTLAITKLLNLPYGLHKVTNDEMWYVFLFCLFIVTLNTFIEFWVAYCLLKPIDAKKLVLVVFFANALSVGSGLLGLLVHRSYNGGDFPSEDFRWRKFVKPTEVPQATEQAIQQ